jgi:hypothetical protein
MDKTQRKITYSTSPSAFSRMATVMGLDPIVALRIRYRYLRGRVAEFRDLFLECPEIDPYFWWWVDAATELSSLTVYAQRYKRKPAGNGITDEMVAIARDYPVLQVVEFVNGHAFAFCHEDHKPSLYYGSRNKSLCCPVCDRQFSALDVLILRDGMSFTAAVSALQ